MFHLTGHQTTITVNVHTPKDFPVDLYYLTDVSRSIEKESIKSLGHLLGKRRKKITCFDSHSTSAGRSISTCSRLSDSGANILAVRPSYYGRDSDQKLYGEGYCITGLVFWTF